MPERRWFTDGFMLLVFGVLLFAGCTTMSNYPEHPRVSLVSIQPKDMTLLEQRYGLQLRILNPNETAIPVEGLSYSLEINGHEFAYGVSRQAVSIPPFGEALLDVDVVSNLLSVMQQVQEMSEEQQESLQYRLAGKISLANSLVKLPFDYHGELKYSPAKTTAP
ncbi:MAG: LEA type 2 family protein [Gammaproteobacteria bacterium]|nr:LEA type 2 family protein [Gammaproteobacteria bacterium]